MLMLMLMLSRPWACIGYLVCGGGWVADDVASSGANADSTIADYGTSDANAYAG